MKIQSAHAYMFARRPAPEGVTLVASQRAAECRRSLRKPPGSPGTLGNRQVTLTGM